MKLILALVGLLLTSEIMACGCSSPTSLSDTHSYGYAFTGEVINIEKSQKDKVIEHFVTFRVTKNIKNVTKNNIKVLFRVGYTSCDLIQPNFIKGESYLLTARSNRFISYTIPNNKNYALYNNYCDLRKKL